MKDVQIDVILPIPNGEIADQIRTTVEKNMVAAEIVENSRHGAETLAARVGGRVRTDRQPEWYIRRGSHFVHGGDYLLVASRWWVTVPNWFDPPVENFALNG